MSDLKNLTKKINFSKDQIASLRFNFLKYNRLLYLKNKKNICKYIVIPFFIDIYKHQKFCYLESSSIDEIKFNLYLNFFSKWLKNLNKLIKKRLSLSGLGFKINIIDESTDFILLKFKLGFSHLITINIVRDKVSVILKKLNLLIKGYDGVFVGNITQKIRNLKIPNSYSGKGFLYKNENFICKTFKKK